MHKELQHSKTSYYIHAGDSGAVLFPAPRLPKALHGGFLNPFVV